MKNRAKIIIFFEICKWMNGKKIINFSNGLHMLEKSGNFAGGFSKDERERQKEEG